MDKDILSKVYFIGGSPCSGKSSIAEKLSKEYNMDYYKIDDYEFQHINRSNSNDHPIMSKFKEIVWDEIWMRPVEVQVNEEWQFYIERFSMILEDLKSYYNNKPIIVEGAALLPELLKGIGVENNKVIYLVPSKDFQVEYYSKRDFIHGILKERKNPEKAFSNWMERDHQFGKRVINQAKEYNMKYILVGGKTTLEKNTKLVMDHFKLRK